MDSNTPLMSTGVLTAQEIDRAFSHYGYDPPGLGGSIIAAAMRTGFNSDVLAMQIADESAWWTSDYAINRNNPSGFGAVDGNPDEAVYFRSVTVGVDVTTAHWLVYTLGDNDYSASLDPRYGLVPPNHRGIARTLADVGNGIWASAPNYTEAILNRWAEVEAIGLGSNPEGDNGVIPDKRYSLPVRLDLQNNGHSFVNRPTNPDGRILAIVKHVSAGESLDGALTWNRNPSVEASAHFYIDKDGTVVQDVSLDNGAWANGVLANPSLPPQFDGVKGNLNDYTISIEHVGNPDDADFPTDAQLTADARLTADLCDYYSIPVDTDHIIGHNRFDSVNRPNCPGPHWNFDADVRAVSRLLNGEPNDGSTDGQPNRDGSSGSIGTGASNPGDSPAGGSSDSRIRKLAQSGYGFSELTPSGDGRGVRIHYPGNDAGFYIGHGFFDKFTDGWDGSGDATERLSASVGEHGVPLSNECTIVEGSNAINVQPFEYDVFAWDGENLSRLSLGRTWRDDHIRQLPTNTYRW